MSDICDITEVGFEADVEEFATIGESADVEASSSNTLFFKLTELIQQEGTLSTEYTELHRQLVLIQATASISYTQVMTGGDFVDVSALGITSLFQKIGDLAAVSASGDTLVFQPPIRDLVIASAVATAESLAGTLIRNLASVSATGVVWIETPIVQFVSVSASAAVDAIQARWASELVDVGAEGDGSLVSEIARVHELIAVQGTASIVSYQHLDAYDLVLVESCVEADIMPEPGVAQGWSAANTSFGMSRHRYPVDISSVAPMDDTFIMAGRGGVYFLNDVDGAEDIVKGRFVDAYLKTPLTDFGESALKRGIALYIAFRSTKPVGVDVGETQTGQERTWSYTSQPLQNIDLRPIRVPIGKGIRSRFLRFTVRNTEGGALTIDSAEADHLSTTRRT